MRLERGEAVIFNLIRYSAIRARSYSWPIWYTRLLLMLALISIATIIAGTWAIVQGYNYWINQSKFFSLTQKKRALETVLSQALAPQAVGTIPDCKAWLTTVRPCTVISLLSCAKQHTITCSCIQEYHGNNHEKKIVGSFEGSFSELEQFLADIAHHYRCSFDLLSLFFNPQKNTLRATLNLRTL